MMLTLTKLRTRGARRVRMAVAVVTVLLLGACGQGHTPALMANTPPPTIRVRLGMPRAQGALQLRAQAWAIRATSGSSFAVHSEGTLKTTITHSAGNIVLRGRSTGAQALRIEPTTAFTLDGRTYRGVLTVRLREGKLLFVNHLDMETYLAGVIGNEVGPGAKAATYRAQAVAARTYAWMRLQRADASTRAFDVYDSSASQVYKGLSIPKQYGIRYADMVSHTGDTRGVIVTHKGRPFRTYYASTCGGHTTQPATSGLDAGRGSEPLRGVACDHCKTSKYFRWTKQVSDAEVIAGLKRKKLPVGAPLHTLKVTRRGRGEWVAEATLTHGPKRAARTVPGHVLRGALGLRSNRIESIQRIRGGWVIKGRGWGHGVGMCQWGAIEMGRKGASETEILRYYYPGVAFTKIY